MRYDVEVSGFPSSHAGHVVLLGLKEQDYPGARRASRTGPRGRCRCCSGPGRRAPSSGSRTPAGACRSKERCAAEPRGARVRRHRRERVHRGRDASRRGRLHLRRRYAVPVGTEHLVSHAERRLPHADQRRDRLPVHLRRSRRPRADLRAHAAPHLRWIPRRGAARRQLRVRRTHPSAGLHRRRDAGRHGRRRDPRVGRRQHHRASRRGRVARRDASARGAAAVPTDGSPAWHQPSSETRCRWRAGPWTKRRTGTSSARASGRHGACRSSWW